MELLIATPLTAYIAQHFIIALVWIVAAILSLSHWRRHPNVSRLTLTAILIFFAESLASICANSYLPFMLRDAGWANGIPTLYFSLTGMISSVIRAMAWSFIVAAIFSQRDKA